MGTFKSGTLQSMTNTSFSKPTVVVLGAGKGTRMVSPLPKVMHPLAHYPLLGHGLCTAQSLENSHVIAVLAPDQKISQDFVAQDFPQVQQVLAEPLGTGYAVRCVFDAVSLQGPVMVTFGDTPLLSLNTLQAVEKALHQHDLVVVAMDLEAGGAYGRIVSDNKGQPMVIVEAKNASAEQLKINRVNAGIMGLRGQTVAPLLNQLIPNDLTGEYYLTDLVALAHSHGLSVGLVTVDPQEVAGVNTREDLAYLEGLYQNKRRAQLMRSGVTLQDPATCYVAYDTQIEPDVTLEPQVYFGPGVRVDRGATIRAFSHIEGAHIASSSVVGPFARLRPGTILEEKAKVGNFVEIKNATLHQGAKVNHLSYVGDATVGAKSNLGAGTITCNYDGYDKHRTQIGAGVFVGSNTALVAPLTIADGAMIGAGSVITASVGAGDMALTRAPLKTLSKGAERFHQRRQGKKG